MRNVLRHPGRAVPRHDAGHHPIWTVTDTVVKPHAEVDSWEGTVGADVLGELSLCGAVLTGAAGAPCRRVPVG